MRSCSKIPLSSNTSRATTVLLKDDKTYPYIAVSNEYLPRIFKTRHRERRGATYYGPYSHLPTMYALLDLCQRLYHRDLATNR